jgi:hypothetical protein
MCIAILLLCGVLPTSTPRALQEGNAMQSFRWSAKTGTIKIIFKDCVHPEFVVVQDELVFNLEYPRNKTIGFLSFLFVCTVKGHQTLMRVLYVIDGQTFQQYVSVRAHGMTVRGKALK